jgi:predicted kinase
MFRLSTFYKSKQWEGLVEQLKIERVNEQGQIICEHCGKPITRKYDCIGHHKTELTEDNVNDYNISLNPANIMLIHFKCHNMIHERFEGFKQEVFLVYGSPCSGKSSWVHEVANPDDLILDIDKLWEAVSIADKYNKPARLKANVFGIRDCILDQIRCRVGLWRNAYVIGGYPLRSDRDRLCDLLGAQPIFIDTTKEECLSRAMNEDWKQFIEDWFDSFVE